MIKFQATAKIHSISPVVDIPSKTGGNPFQKRELVLDDSYSRDGQTYCNYVLVEFTGEKMQMLDGYAPGQLVSVEGVISGRAYNDRVFNTVKGLNIAPYQTRQTAQPQEYAQYPRQQSQFIAPGVHQTARPQQPPVASGYPAMPGNAGNGYYPG